MRRGEARRGEARPQTRRGVGARNWESTTTAARPARRAGRRKGGPRARRDGARVSMQQPSSAKADDQLTEHPRTELSIRVSRPVIKRKL